MTRSLDDLVLAVKQALREGLSALREHEPWEPSWVEAIHGDIVQVDGDVDLQRLAEFVVSKAMPRPNEA